MNTGSKDDIEKSGRATRAEPPSKRSGFSKAALLVAGIALSSCHGAGTTQAAREADAPPRSAVEEGRYTCEKPLVASEYDSSTRTESKVCTTGAGCSGFAERRSTTTVRVGDNVPDGPFTLRVSGIDSAGVDFVFEEPGIRDQMRLDYGKARRIGEYVLISTMKVERGPLPGTAKVVACQPLIPGE